MFNSLDFYERYLGNGVFEVEDNYKVFEGIKSIYKEGEYEEIIEEYKNLSELKGNDIITLESLDIEEFQCNSICWFEIEYEIKTPLYNLEELIDRQYEFKDYELIEIIKGLVECLRQLKELNEQHNYLHPCLIFFEKENVFSCLKLLLWINNPMNYIMNYKTEIYLNQKIYLNQYIYNKVTNISESNIKDNNLDLFSIGLIVLEAGLEESVEEIFELENKIFDEKNLMNKIIEFKEKYFSETNNKLFQMIDFLLLEKDNENSLEKFIETFGSLSKIEENIDEVIEMAVSESNDENTEEENDSFYESIDEIFENNNEALTDKDLGLELLIDNLQLAEKSEEKQERVSFNTQVKYLNNKKPFSFEDFEQLNLLSEKNRCKVFQLNTESFFVNQKLNEKDKELKKAESSLLETDILNEYNKVESENFNYLDEDERYEKIVFEEFAIDSKGERIKKIYIKYKLKNK